MANEFELLRQKALQQAGSQDQARTDAMKRRFAAQGGLGSGAFIKAQQMAIDEGQRARQEATTGIDIAEAQQNRQDQETAIERAFREKQAQIQQEQFGKQFGLQEQQLGMSKEQQRMQAEQFGKQFGLQESQFGLDKKMKEQLMTQQADEFERQKIADAQNMLVNAGVDSTGIKAFINIFEQTGKIPTIEEISASIRQKKSDFNDRVQANAPLTWQQKLRLRR